jgi:hypothetical protein
VGLHAGYTSSLARQDALVDWLGHDNTALAGHPARPKPFPASTKGAVPSSRPGWSDDRSGGRGREVPKTTAVGQSPCGGPSLRSRSLQEGSMHDDVNNVLGNDT